MKLAATLLLSFALASLSFAYDITDLAKDMQAFHEKQKTEVSDISMDMTGIFTSPHGQTDMTATYRMKGNLWRNDANAGGFKMTMLFDGTDYWNVMMGSKTKIAKEEIAGKTSEHAMWQESLEGYTLSGEASANGRDCYVLEGKDLPKTWLDKKTYMIVRSESTEGGKTVVTNHTDFKAVKDDFEIPYHSETLTGDQKTGETTITKLVYNTGLSDDLFDASKLEGKTAQTTGAPNMMNPAGMNMDSLKKAMEEMKKQYQQQQQGR